MEHEIRNLLPPGHPWGQRLICLDTVDSTNAYAKALAKDGAPEGTTVIARTQTCGRGRMGRSFFSPAGQGLYFSLILRPACPPEALMHLTCAAGVAAADAVEQAAGFRPGIKWINDLIYQRRKLGGILTELSIRPDTGMVAYVIIGIGINCGQRPEDFPPELQALACSVATVTGQALSPACIAAALLQTLHNMYAGLLQDKATLMARFRQDCVTLGKPISLLHNGLTCAGIALDTDENGGLIVQLSDGSIQTVTSGEVSVRGLYGYV